LLLSALRHIPALVGRRFPEKSSSVYDARFVRCRAAALYVAGGTFVLHRAVFRKNLATGGRGMSTAGAVWIGFTRFNITESQFIANVAQSSGTDCTSSLQRDNAWGVGAGALYMQSCVGSILGTRFESNVVTGGKVFTVGAALWAQADVNVVLGGSLFLQNKMQMGSQDDTVSGGCMGGGPDDLAPFAPAS
jgi:hypothetical protein